MPSWPETIILPTEIIRAVYFISPISSDSNGAGRGRLWLLRVRRNLPNIAHRSAVAVPSAGAPHCPTASGGPDWRMSRSDKQVLTVIAASRIPPWLPSGWGRLGRRLSRVRGNPDTRHGLWPGRAARRTRAPVPAGPARPMESSRPADHGGHPQIQIWLSVLQSSLPVVLRGNRYRKHSTGLIWLPI